MGADLSGPIDVVAVHRESFARCSPATAAAFPEPRRMDAGALAGFLARKHYLVLSSTRADGRPHAAMTAFLLDGGRFWCPTMPGTVRARNIEREPSVALVVTEGEGDEHAVVLVDGEAALRPEGSEPDGFHRRWDAKFGWAADWARSWVVVTPARVLSFAAAGWR